MADVVVPAGDIWRLFKTWRLLAATLAPLLVVPGGSWQLPGDFWRLLAFSTLRIELPVWNLSPQSVI